MVRNEDLISIIIPVWNVENYLSRCLTSVVNQTYKNLEIILVDDGSSDTSPLICDEWEQKDSRITVIHKVNGGASDARNCGISNSSDVSKYIIFVDSDDYIYPNTVEYLYNAITSGDFDFVSNYDCEKTIDLKVDHGDFLKYITMVYSYGPVEKIFRTDLIKDNLLSFDPWLKTAEDALFIRQYLSLCNRIKLINEKLYFYFQGNSNSLTKRGYCDYCLYFKMKLDALDKLLDHIGLSYEQKIKFLSERAIHGIKVSLEHYYINFDSKQVKQLGQKTIDTLCPYIQERVNIDPKLKKYLFTVVDEKRKSIRWIKFKSITIKTKLKIKIYNLYKKIRCSNT